MAETRSRPTWRPRLRDGAANGSFSCVRKSSLPSWLALSAATLLLPAGAIAGAAPQPRPLAPGRYCLKEATEGFSGQGADIPLGYTLMQLEIAKAGTGYSIHFWNQLPDNDQLLEGGSDQVRVRRDGSLVFEFEDGWGNKGRARVRPDGAVTLTEIEQAPGNQIGRNYGDYRVKRAACSAPEFRHSSKPR